jgi:hypothetical protein
MDPISWYVKVVLHTDMAGERSSAFLRGVFLIYIFF